MFLELAEAQPWVYLAQTLIYTFPPGGHTRRVPDIIGHDIQISPTWCKIRGPSKILGVLAFPPLSVLSVFPLV